MRVHQLLPNPNDVHIFDFTDTEARQEQIFAMIVHRRQKNKTDRNLGFIYVLPWITGPLFETRSESAIYCARHMHARKTHNKKLLDKITQDH